MDLVPGINQRVAEGVFVGDGSRHELSPQPGARSVLGGPCPGNNESAGKRKSGKTQKGNQWLHRYLIEASWAAVRKRGMYLSVLYYRWVLRHGKNRAVVAVAQALLVMIYHVLKDKVSYRELGSDHFNKLSAAYISATM